MRALQRLHSSGATQFVYSPHARTHLVLRRCVQKGSMWTKQQAAALGQAGQCWAEVWCGAPDTGRWVHVDPLAVRFFLPPAQPTKQTSDPQICFPCHYLPPAGLCRRLRQRRRQRCHSEVGMA